MPPFLLFVFSLLLSITKCAEHVIHNTSEFIAFSDSVNDGTSFSGTTVFLDSDIDFAGGYSEQFNPVGNTSICTFKGSFDGQGHVIKNLRISLSLKYFGLFGYSSGSTINSIVIDSTCTIASSFLSTSDDDGYVGGLIAKCSSTRSPCVIEGAVNMGSVSFEGNTSENVYTGGIIGSSNSKNYQNVLKNSVNYGPVTHSGTCGNWAEVGGVASYVQEEHFISKVYIMNCVNYGTVTYNGTSGNFIIGGIVGNSWSSVITNCANLGAISTNDKSKCIGGILGDASQHTEISRCYWSSEGGHNLVGNIASTSTMSKNIPFEPTTLVLDDFASFGNMATSFLTSALNEGGNYYPLRGYSSWVHNKNNRKISLTVNGVPMSVVMDYKIVPLSRNSTSGVNTLNGWYIDSECTTPFRGYETETDLSLYGKVEGNFNNYTISFDTRGGTPIDSITAQFKSAVPLPNGSTRDYCEFEFWENEYGDIVPYEFSVPAQDITLYAVWLCTHISTDKDLVSFSKLANQGKNFSGTTIFLDSDIRFSGAYSEPFEPINHFNGIFDGQGHTIDHLTTTTLSRHTGLFGFSEGATVKNLVIGDSCVFRNSVVFWSDDNGYVGGIFGRCSSEQGPCIVDNCINMGNSVFDGNITYNVYVGGIVGYLYTEAYPSTVRNCVNYGSVTHSGRGSRSYIGGVIGRSYSASREYIIEGNANYGKVNFEGNALGNMFIGGVVGSLVSSDPNCITRNCINLGTVVHFGNSSSAYLGGVVGRCTAERGPCATESSVNMGSVLFMGNSTKNMYIGGIAGYLDPNAYPCILKNCVNYGTGEHLGICDDYAKMGGIVGISDAATQSTNNYIQNCLNYGTIAQRGETAYLAIGGIVGSSYYAVIENCVNSGSFEKSKTTKNVGAIAGKIAKDSVITNSYWTSDFGDVNAYGSNKDKVNVTKSSLIAFDQTALNKLNQYIKAEKDDSWSKWVMLDLNGGKINNTSQDNLFEIQKHFPVPAMEGNSFLFWYKDAECTEAFDPENDELGDLYAGWDINTITFDFGNGTTTRATLHYNETINYPKSMVREGYTFSGWDKRPDHMPPRDVTIKAQWAEEVVSKSVEIVFDTKSMGSKGEEEMREEISEAIKAYTDEEFVIERIESDPATGETKVIVRFVDTEKAGEFVRVVNEHRYSDGPIKIVRAISDGNFSPHITVLSITGLFFLSLLS